MIIASNAPAPKRIHKSKQLLGVSAITFLILCIWIGPNRACFLVAIIAIGWTWFCLCRRYPLVAWFSLGFIEGLCGSRRRR